MPNPYDIYSIRSQQRVSDAIANRSIITQHATTAVERLSRAEMKMARAADFSATGVARGAITMDNFGGFLTSATKKVLVWQAAIMAVYGVIRKVGEAIETWKTLELTLQRISITTGAAGKGLQQFFAMAANVAVEFGKPIEQVLEGMDLALRATAKYGDVANRTAIAITLLKDASALANITGMQYNQAMDILVGSLRQTGMELDQGSALLDKWVAVAKNAATNVNDLSQGFAIMADAARSAGLSVDQVNGVIAALSEAVTLGPVQVGNAIRALMSTLYNPGSISLMQKFGVAVRNVDGEMRNFWEVMTQLSAMKMADVLDESQWLEIGKAAGAGQRRYAQFLALLNNWSTAMRVAGVSATAELGTAMDANTLIVDTLSNSFDKLTAAQREFFMAIGNGLGIIEDMSGVLVTLTSIFQTLSGVSGGMITLGKAIMYFVGTLVALKIAALSLRWMGAGPMFGGMMGKYGGIRAEQITGSRRAGSLIQGRYGGDVAEAGKAGIGLMPWTGAAMMGMWALSGLLPGAGTGQKRYDAPGGGWRWQRGAPGGIGGQYAPAPRMQGVLGAPPLPYLTPITGRDVWGKMTGVGQRQIGPMGAGGQIPMGTTRGWQPFWARQMAQRGGMWGAARGVPSLGGAVGGLAMGGAAYAVTGEKWVGAGTAIAGGIGAALAGPIGMVAGGVIGGVIGKVASQAFIDEETRIRNIFSKISAEYKIDISERAYEILKGAPEALGEEIEYAFGAPMFPQEFLAQQESFITRMMSTPVFAQIMGFFNPSAPGAQGVVESFSRPPVGYGGKTGAGEWAKGFGAMSELNQALEEGIVTREQYIKAMGEEGIIWSELNEYQKAYISYAGLVAAATEEDKAVYESAMTVLAEIMEQRSKLMEVDNEYSFIQERIIDVVEKLGLKEWEEIRLQELLDSKLRITTDSYEEQRKVITGIHYGYASYLEALGRLAPAMEQAFKTTMPEGEEWQLPAIIQPSTWEELQKYGADVALGITNLIQQITTSMMDTKAFEALHWEDILGKVQMEASIDQVGEVKDALIAMQNSVDDKLFNKWLSGLTDEEGRAIARTKDLMQLVSDLNRAAIFEHYGETRTMGAEKFKAWQEMLPKLPDVTDWVEQAFPGAIFGETFWTLIDTENLNTQQVKGNTLAIEIMSALVADNTKAQERMLDIGYNIPSQYAMPTRFQYYQTLTPQAQYEFGPAQKKLWADWESFSDYLNQEAQAALEGFTGTITESASELEATWEGLDELIASWAAGIETVEDTTVATWEQWNEMMGKDIDAIGEHAEVVKAAYESMAGKWPGGTVPYEDWSAQGETVRDMLIRMGYTLGEAPTPLPAEPSSSGWGAFFNLVKNALFGRGIGSIETLIPSRQHGGNVGTTGTYYLHKGEQVVTYEGIQHTNTLLTGMSHSFYASQQHLSSINTGISSLRAEVRVTNRKLQSIIDGSSVEGETATNVFARTSSSGMLSTSFGGR